MSGLAYIICLAPYIMETGTPITSRVLIEIIEFKLASIVTVQPSFLRILSDREMDTSVKRGLGKGGWVGEISLLFKNHPNWYLDKFKHIFGDFFGL